MPIPGVQLYSVRDDLASAPKDCIRRLADIGFMRAEGYDLIQLKHISPLLRDAGISVHSSFILWSHVTERHDLAKQINYPWLPEKWGIDFEIERAKSLGLDTLVLGYLLPEERKTLDDFKRLAEQFNHAGEACKNAGINFLYHNHAFEFEEREGQVPYFYLLENTQPDYVNFELDVLWVQLAGHNPAEFIRAYQDRIKQLHLKSGWSVDIPLYDDHAYSPSDQDCALGDGIVDIQGVVNAFNNNVVQDAYIEQEYGQDLYRSLSSSINYLKAITSPV